MDEQLKAAMREILLDRYGVDIQKAKCHFSTQNYAFIFPGEPFMIRVSATPKKTRKEILSELIWLDDLKQFKNTVCEPNVSPRGNLLEEFEINGKTYLVGAKDAKIQVVLPADAKAEGKVKLTGTVKKDETNKK